MSFCNIMLGNLSIEDLERRLGVDLPSEFKESMNKGRQQIAESSALKENEWHLFDLPLMMVCGSFEMASYVNETLKPLADQFKDALQIAVGGKGRGAKVSIEAEEKGREP